VSRLNDHSEDGIELVELENCDIVIGYKHSIGNLTRCLVEEWQRYITTMEDISESLRYRVAISDRTGRGRPQFVISK